MAALPVAPGHNPAASGYCLAVSILELEKKGLELRSRTRFPCPSDPADHGQVLHTALSVLNWESWSLLGLSWGSKPHGLETSQNNPLTRFQRPDDTNQKPYFEIASSIGSIPNLQIVISYKNAPGKSVIRILEFPGILRPDSGPERPETGMTSRKRVPGYGRTRRRKSPPRTSRSSALTTRL